MLAGVGVVNFGYFQLCAWLYKYHNVEKEDIDSGTMAGLSLTAFGVSSNLIVYLIEKFNVKSIDAAQIFNIVNGCISLLPIVGAIISDSFFGSFPVISVTSFISLLGTVLLTLIAALPSLRSPTCINGSSTCEPPPKSHFMALYAGIALVTIGIGGTRFNIASMGANQFQKLKDRDSFFNWYFFTMYAAAVIASTCIVYVQDNVGWGLGFGLCAAINGLSLALLLLGRRYYRHVRPEGSPFTGLARVVIAAIRKRKLTLSSIGEDYYQGFLNKAALKSEGDMYSNGSIAKPWRLCSVEQVEDLKTLIKIFPIWSSTIFISTPIGVLNSLTILQALSMDRHLGPHFSIPAGSFFVFVILSTSLALPIIDRFLYPRWRKLTGLGPTPLQRLGLGHIFNILGLVGSALVESRRLHVVRAHNLQDHASSVVPMSALWLVLPLALVGIGEAFHFPGGVALYYQEFPASLHSTATAMTALIIGIGYYLSTAIVGLVRRVTEWLPDNINSGRIDNVYWMLAAVGVVNFGYFQLCAWLYKYHNVEKEDTDSASPSSATPTLLCTSLKKFNVKSIDAAQIFNIVNGCISLLPIVGAIISNSFFGSFPVISFTSFISLLFPEQSSTEK
ncbi:Proton-dependent oligopeptide transporter family [Cinnamomum micranthum f. kanehirae]|uniref:Proton-dependent oligopeptide transporter family n=1 Tax=Cinnamomum micranthum f. kanehirae TaxID=337451 RepID=A0A3S3MNJ6_9MAGN|nr:Proton-dependent oligopeptide transporter family [Cinnamomum micranthum f. kanehirae]